MNDARNPVIGINRMLPWILQGSFILVWLAADQLRLVPSYVLPHPKEIIIAGILIIAVIGRISDQMLTACLRLWFKSARRSA